jgi:uridine kinase
LKRQGAFRPGSRPAQELRAAQNLPLRGAVRRDKVQSLFLLRPELAAAWDCRVFVDIALEEVVRRAVVRDRDLFGAEEIVRERYERRYLPAQRAYLEQARPREQADVVVENTRVERPVLAKVAR